MRGSLVREHAGDLTILYAPSDSAADRPIERILSELGYSCLPHGTAGRGRADFSGKPEGGIFALRKNEAGD
jgi:hypothetical protein